MPFNAAVKTSRSLSAIEGVGIAKSYEVEHQTRGSRAILKVLNSALASDPSQRLRFLQNARRFAGIQDPSLGVILEVGDDPDTSVPHVIREFEPGEELTDVLEREELDTEVACAIAARILSGLQALHAAGLCHGNLKPSNVFVERDEQDVEVHLVDMGWQPYGLFSGGTEYLEPDTRYVSPEALMGVRPDARSDLFSVAVMLYEMLAGAPIVDSTDNLETFRAVASGTVEPLSRRNPRVPEALTRAVETCLAADPEDRLPSASAFLRQLRPYLPREHKSGAFERGSFHESGEFKPATPSLQERLAPRPRRDDACPDRMLIAPAFPKTQPSALLEELREDVELCPPSETEGYVSTPPRPIATSENRAALFAIGTGVSLGAVLGWLSAMM